MRFRFEWFNPFRNPLRLYRETRKAIIWLNNLEDTNEEYRKYSRMGTSALVGMMMQFFLLMIVYTVGVSLFD